MNEHDNDRALVVAAGRLQSLLHDLVREIHGDSAVERRARYDGDHFPEFVPTPLTGLWAADGLLNRVSQEVHRHARRAREAGHTWEQIEGALDIKPDGGRSVAEAAYERFTGTPAGWPLSGPGFTWRCPHCDRVISDRGPYESHPDDNQPGHAPGCARLAAELSRWRSSWDDIDTVTTDA